VGLLVLLDPDPDKADQNERGSGSITLVPAGPRFGVSEVVACRYTAVEFQGSSSLDLCSGVSRSSAAA
jgi:hypothetical protein